jgi:putative tryptophan/tyrosine transport system substrate-binding protein
MRRRDFILACGATAAWSRAARAQRKAMPVIGFMHSGSQQGAARNVDTLRQSLREAGYVEGQNVAIEYRWADNQYDRLPALAADLVARQVDLIMACGVTIGSVSAKKATSTIPIVFVVGGDPIAAGLVTSLNPRSGNVTGATFFGSQLGPKRLELLLELVPEAKSVRLLSNPDNSHNVRTERTAVDAAARRLGLHYDVVNARSEGDLEKVFAALVREGVGALVVSNDALFNNRTEQLVALAARHAIPTIYFLREFAAAGGLISYGASITNTYRLAASYVARILGGTKPAELPVLQPTKFELVINLKTARALGLAVSPMLLALADEVIE